jgi:phenylalanyl-tRNA synthetase beta chain
MEDILRIYGYNNVPLSRQSRLSYDLEQNLDTQALLQRYLDYLAANGWSEIITNPLVPARFGHEGTANLINNLSEDLAVMRERMLLTGLDVLGYNHNRKNTDLRLVEFAKTYHRGEGGYNEREWLAFFLTGAATPMHWQLKTQPSSFFTLVRELDRLQACFGFMADLREISDSKEFAYGMELVKGDRVIARFGKVHPQELKGKDVKGDVFFAEVDWENVIRLHKRNKVSYTPLPKFPAVKRDISMLVPRKATFQQLAATAKACNPKIIKEVSITDVYEGPNIGEGKRSYLISLMLLDEQKTLTDDVTDKLMAKVFERLATEHLVEIRK